MALIRRY